MIIQINIMKLTALITLLFFACTINGQKVYSKTFGNPLNKPLIFLHGGPGYNSVNFEVTTAKRIAENGFYVIVYDRRGEGRSQGAAAKFTFEETFNDLLNIYRENNLSKVTLLGHSFGGIVATLFAEKYPDKVNQIVLISAPVSLQETFNTIINSCISIYETKKDSTNLMYISMLESMDKTSIEFSSYCFAHAIQNGFYFPKNLSEEAKSLYSNMRNDTLIKKYASQMTIEAPQGFWQNEKYTTINLTSNLKNLKVKGVPVFGLYGKDDGLYSFQQVENLKNILGNNNLKYFENCSHNVFCDQQTSFVDSIVNWIK